MFFKEKSSLRDPWVVRHALFTLGRHVQQQAVSLVPFYLRHIITPHIHNIVTVL